MYSDITQAVRFRSPDAFAPAPDSVAGELNTVLNSAAFRRAPRLRRLLEFAVYRVLDTGCVTERDAARDVFGKGDDFDPSTDPTVRVHYGRLRRRLEDYFTGEGSQDKVRIRIPARGYSPIFDYRPQLENMPAVLSVAI